MDMDQIIAIEEAIELIERAQALVDEAMCGASKEAHYLAYGRYGFDQLLGNGNPYNSSLQSLIEGSAEIEQMRDDMFDAGIGYGG